MSTAGTARPRPQGQVTISTAAAMLVARRQSPVASAPAEQRGDGEDVDDRGVGAGGAVGEAGVAAAAALGGLDQAGDLARAACPRRARRRGASSGPVRFSMPARTRGAGGDRLGHGLAGQERGVDLGAARGDGAVDGDAGAGGDGEEVAGAQRVERHGLAAAVGGDALGDADLERGELGGGGAGGGAGAVREVAADQQEEGQHDRRLEVGARAGERWSRAG